MYLLVYGLTVTKVVFECFQFITLKNTLPGLTVTKVVFEFGEEKPVKKSRVRLTVTKVVFELTYPPFCLLLLPINSNKSCF